MVGNVFRVIMPAQRDLVKAIQEQRPPDPELPAKALLRSRHNNYMTLPVLFIMISNHFPSTYGSSFNWAILAGLSVVGIMLRHYFNTRHLSQKFIWLIPAAALGMIILAFVSSPYKSTGNAQQKTHDVAMASVDDVKRGLLALRRSMMSFGCVARFVILSHLPTRYFQPHLRV